MDSLSDGEWKNACLLERFDCNEVGPAYGAPI